MFETSGFINESLLREIGKDLLPHRQRQVFAVVVIAVFLVVLINLYLGQYEKLWAPIALFIILLIEGVLLQRKALKVNLNRMREVSSQPEALYTSRLEDTGIYLENQTTHASATIAYETIIYMRETPSAYILFTKSWQFLPVFKSGLPDQGAFLDYLRSRLTRIKWKL